MFSLRIVATDHYLCPPIPELDVRYSDLTQSEIWRVPVIRVYGSTPSGQKTCMHVHGVFPYLYVPYDGTQPWDRYLKLFARSLDKALNVSLNKVNSNTQHVYKINLVSGIPMYGYHEKEEQFLKIFLYNPRMVKKAADLLLGGAVMNKAFQPHEAHIPYILQMFIDYNLYGMNMINVCAVKFRKQKTDEDESCYLPHESYDRMQKKKESEESSPSTPTSLFDRTEMVTHKTWDISNIQEELLLDESITRQSTCELECDVVAPDILNRQDVDDKIGINPGLAALWEDEKQRKRNIGETSQITPPDSQERENIEMSESDQMLRLKYLQIIQDQKPYIDSQTTDESQGSVRDNSQASVLDMQLSEEGLESSSLDTVIIEEDEMIPVISVDSIKRVVSMSQSFSASQPSQANSQDKSLADILASLADENCSSSSQEIAQQITALEERDSILLDKSQPIDDEDDKQQDEETLEMTQVVFDDMNKNEDISNQQEEMIIPESRSVDFNLEGLDDTWNMSQFLQKDDEDGTDDDIPQFDGVGDELGRETETEKNHQKPFVSNQVLLSRNIENNSYTPSLGSNSQNENADQLSSQSQNETISAKVSYRKRYREDNSVNLGHGFDNFGNLVSSHQTGNDIHKGNANLHSINQINSSHSRLGNNGNHSKILDTSTHDSNHGCKQSPIHSSQNIMSTSSPGIKSPVNEDNQGSFKSINAQLPLRMTPSPEKDNFTVHHYSQDGLQGSKEIGSVQDQMLQSDNNYHRNMPSLNDLMPQSHFHMSNVNQYDSIKGHSSYRQFPATSNVQSVSQPVVNKLLQTGYQVNSGSQPVVNNSLQTDYQVNSGSQKTLPGSHYKRNQNRIISSSSNHQMPHTPSYKIPQEQQHMQKSSENNLFSPANLQTLLLPQSYQHAQSGSIVSSQITKEHLTNCNNQNNQSDQQFSATNAFCNLQTSPMNELHNVHNIQYTLPMSSNDHFYMQSQRNSVDNFHEYSHRKIKQTSVGNVSSSSLTHQHSRSNVSSSNLTHQHSGSNVSSSSLTHQHSGSNVSSSNLTHQHSGSNVSSSSLTHQHSGSNVSSSSLKPQHSRSNVSSSNLTHQHSGSNVSLSSLTHQHTGCNVSSSNLTHQHSGSNVSSLNLTHRHSGRNVSSSNLTHQHSGHNVSSSSLTHQHSGRNVSSSNLTHQHSGSNGYHFQEKSFHQLLTEDEYLSKQDNSEDDICFQNSQLSENTTNYKSKPYTKLIPKCHQYTGQSSNQHLCLPSNSKAFVCEPSKYKRIHNHSHVEQNRQQLKNLTEFNQTSSFHPVESKDQSINSSLQRSITEDLKKKQDMSVIHQTHKGPHNIGYIHTHSGMQPMQQNPKAKELSRSTNIRQKLQRIPSASTIMPSMHENIKKSTSMKNEGISCKNFPSKHEPSTLERLLLYGNDDTNMETSSNQSLADNSTEVYVQSTSESTDLFLHSSQSSSSQRAFSQPQTNCESSVKTSKSKGSDRKNTLSSLETLVKNVNQGSSFGYQYKSPVHSQDSNNFDPFSVSDTNSLCNTSESSSYSWQKSPAHNNDTESSSDFSHPKLSGRYDGSKSTNQFCVHKSPSQFGSKPPNHVGLGRSLSYSGSLHYDNFNSTNTLKEQNKMYLHEQNQHPLDLNHTWSESSKNVKKQKAAIKRSHSFTFEKKVQQGTRTNSIQQMKPHFGVKSKKPLTPNRAYSFVFHLPTPFYKKLKFKDEKPLKHDISVVRMHPMDARRYSLLKIGRGIVKVKKLSQTDIDQSGITLKASLEELLRIAENNQKHRSGFYQKCVQNYRLKSPYDIKTQDVKFVNEINVSNKKENLISKKHKSLANMTNVYREPMIAPPAQTLAASSKHCHSIQKVTLTSIIENALITTISKENEEENTINLPHTGTGSSDHWKENDQQSMQYLMSHSFENNGNYNKNVSHDEIKDTSLNQSHQVILNFEEKELVDRSGLDKLMLYNNCSPVDQNLSSGKCDSSLLETNLSGNDSQLCENSVKKFSKNSNCLASVNYISGNLSANMMFPTHSLLITNGNSEKKKIDSSKGRIATNEALNNCCHDDKKNSMLCSKRSMNKMLTSPTAVTDSEIGDTCIILKDESLTDASDHLLTPNISKPRTPVAGCSPISQQNIDGEILNFKGDFEKANKDFNHYDANTGITSGSANTKTDKSIIAGFVENKEFVASEKCLDQNSLKCLNPFTKHGNGYKKRKLLENLTVTYGPAKWKKTVKSQELSNVSSESSNDDSLHHFDFFSLEKENGVQSSEQKRSCGYHQGLTIDCIGKPYPTCKRKSSLSMNRKLQVAFLGKRAKRKKQVKHASKNSKIQKSILGLSLLHEATLANLTESKSSNEVDLAETDSEFEDVLSKMALYSSPETDSLDSLPPQPFSPEGLSHNLQSLSSSEYFNKKEFSNLEMETSKLGYMCHIDNSERLLNQSCNTDGFSNCDDHHFSKTDCCKKAVVKLNRLSEYEIEKYKKEKQNIETEQENSTPDLEPKTISQYPKYGSCRNEKNHTEKSHINPTEVSSCNSKYGDLDSLSEPTLSITADKITNEQLLKSCETQVGVKTMEISMSKLVTNDKVNINPVYLKGTESLPAKDDVCELVQHNLIRTSDYKVFTSKLLPPSKKYVTDTALKLNLNQANNQNAFCSNPDDIPEKPKELGGRKLNIESTQLSELAEFNSDLGSDNIAKWRGNICSAGNDFVKSKDILDRIDRDRTLQFSLVDDAHVIITPCKTPPLCKHIRDWKTSRQVYKHRTVKDRKKVDIKKQEQIEFKRIQKFQQKRFSVKPNKSVSFNGQYCEKMSSSSKASRKRGNEMKSNIDENSLICDSSRDDTEDDVIGTSPPDVTPSNRNIKHILCDSSRDDTEDDVIGPSPPGVTPSNRNIKHILQNRLFSSQPGLLYSPLLPSHQTLHSTPLTKVRNNNLVLPACTPINHLKKEAPLSRLEAVNTGKGELSIELQQYSTPVQKRNVSQIDGPTPKNSFGFQISQQNFHDAKALHVVQNMTVLSMELLADSRGDLLSDPEVDAIKALFYTIHNDMNDTDITGIIVVDTESTKIQEKLREKSKQSAHLSTCNSQNPSTSTDTTCKQSAHLSTCNSQNPSTSTDTTCKQSAHLSTSTNQNPSTSTDTTSSSVTPVSKSESPKTSNVKDNKRDRTPCLKDTEKSDQLSSKLQRNTSFSGVHLNQTLLQKSGIDDNLQIAYVETEIGLFNSFKDLITRLDPDLLVGYEIQKSSWGYLLQRAAQVGIDLCSQISRIPEEKRGSHFSAEKDEYGADSMSEIHIVGRIVLNLWRVMRHEVTLNIYTFENVMFHVLHQRTPKYSFRNLNTWYNKKTHNHRVRANLQIMEQIDLVGRTSEFARVFGIEFYHVLSRGSQYRVESMMLRLAKPMNFIAVSPNVHQRARMRAPECIPLTLEPESRFYHDPVIVVDFQSLYPSIMIAYNYCFSTCVGRISLLEKAHEGAIEFGCTHLKIPPSVLKKIQDDVTVSPNGVVFVKQSVRKGIISAMVEDILNTRIMVKKAMKDCKKDKTLYRLLHARQLGLKLIANVTYGYTAANFSGRMPCIEVGDSIVRKARETLERSIKLVEDTPKWGAKVLYGDTDSMFILLKGRSKDDAFKIGYEICDAVTDMHPSPIKLKFEKVYLPCVLQTKKRYVGFSYETPDQKEPIFDAKGIETVRRDACPAVAKILERSIKVLFTTKDVSQVKQYVQNQCRKIMEEKVSMLDLVFAKEFRGMSGYKPGACVPALEISRKMLQHDRRSEPSVGERVPYVIVYGSPGLPLIQLVKQPFELLTDPSLRINVTYYITKQILPPVGRILSLIGIDVFSWYIDMPKIIRVVPHSVIPSENRKGTISQYFSSSNCPVCEKATNQNICDSCMQDPQKVTTVLNSRIRKWEKVHYRMLEICNCCMGAQDEKQQCVSLDCPILYRLNLALKDSHKGRHFRDIINKCFEF